MDVTRRGLLAGIIGAPIAAAAASPATPMLNIPRGHYRTYAHPVLATQVDLAPEFVDLIRFDGPACVPMKVEGQPVLFDGRD